jgi:hypothetical protein
MCLKIYFVTTTHRIILKFPALHVYERHDCSADLGFVGAKRAEKIAVGRPAWKDMVADLCFPQGQENRTALNKEN